MEIEQQKRKDQAAGNLVFPAVLHLEVMLVADSACEYVQLLESFNGPFGCGCNLQAADLISRIAAVMKKCGEDGLMGHLGVVLYEYLGEEYPEVLGSILGALKVDPRSISWRKNLALPCILFFLDLRFALFLWRRALSM